ncbi:MAG TPA: CPBP family intramembrane glutamic endopeptidase [Thermoleophilaceae bacterium]|nr:CPBP family intramembrane glutamic endopeptidase [Thermoleophilaceae bacterium]
MEHLSLPQPAPAAPPDLPELPDGARPRWPAWYGPAAFVVGLIGTLLVVGVLAAATGNTEEDSSPAFTIVSTLVQNAVLVATAIVFASMVRRPRAWHFGLRSTRLWPAVGWAAVGMVSFYVFAIAYTAIVQPDAEQTVAEDLGAEDGTLGLIAAGVMVMCVAPIAEEFFFRGFFYGALRSRFRPIGAALIAGLLFGLIHFDFSGSDALLILPPLAVLGVVFCLVYERTGSLYPPIALHALNNTIAYAAATDGDGALVCAVLGPAMIAGCVVVPWLRGRGRRPAPAPL